MADSTRKETVVLDFQVDTGDAVKSIGNLTKANKDLREERKNLDLSTKEGQARIKEINKEIEDNNKTIKLNTSVVKENKEEIDKNTKATAQSAEKQKQLDDQVKKNTTTIKDNVDVTKKQKVGVEEIASGIDRLIPGFDIATKGIGKFTQSALTFLATPIGIVIAALGVAVASVTAYFKGSEEGQNKWNKVVAIGSTLLEKLMDVAEAIGGALVAIFEDPQKAIEDFWKLLKENVVNRFEGLLELIPALGKSIELLFKGEFGEAGKVAFDAVAKVTTGISNASDKIVAFTKEVIATTELAIAQGLKLAAIQAKIDEDERDLIEKRAKVDLEVSKLREKAISQEGDLKRKTINEAISLERKLADAEVRHAKDKQAQAALELKANGDDKDALMKVAEANAAVINAEAQRYQATLRFSKEIEKLNDAEAAQVKKLAAEKLKDETDYKAAQVKNVQDSEDQMAAILADSKKREEEASKNLAKKQGELYDFVRDSQIKNIRLVFDAQKINFKAGFDLLKQGALKSVLADTNKAAVAAMASASEIPFVGFILGPIAYAATYAAGLASVASIAGLSFGFKQGGFTGAGNSNEIAGPVHRNEFVMPAPIVAKYGKEHFQSYMDGSVVANSMTKGMSGSSGQNMQPIYVSWKEFTEYRDRQDVKKAVVTA